MFAHKKLPLRGAWYGLIFLASVLPAVVLSPWLSEQARGLLLERAMLKESLYHEQLETRLDLEIERLRTVLHNKADPIAYFLKRGNLHEIKSLIAKIAVREQMVNTTTIYDQHANIIVSAGLTNHALAEVDPTQPVFAVPMLGRVFLGSPATLDDEHLEFTMSVPIIVEHNTVAVMVSTINVNAFWQAIKDSTSAHQSTVYLIDSRGSLLNNIVGGQHQQGDLLSSKKIVRSLLAGKEWNSPESFIGFEGTKVFAISSLVKGLQWGIISEIPAKVISAPIITALTTLTIIVFLLHLVFGLLGLFFTRRLLSPITDLASVVKQATEGDYSQQAKPSPYQEIDALTSAYNVMISEIDQRERSLKKMHYAMDCAGDSILMTNHKGEIEYVNAAFCRMTGYAQHEVIGLTPGAMMKSGQQPQRFYKEMWATIQRGEIWDGELIDRRKDGQLFPVAMTISPVFADGKITHFIAIQQDVSKQRALEEELRQSQKMEAVGILVGGIAHDFNNILAGVTGNMYLAKAKIESGKALEAVDKISNIQQLCDQAASMISQLLAFARKDIVQMHELSLYNLMEESLKFARVTISENIRFHFELSQERFMILGDVSQLQQVLINLLNNACDAVETVAAPCIDLRLFGYMPDDAFVALYPEAEGQRYVCLSIRDNGCGIKEDDLNQIFDPFFTTKAVGKGTGLGLSMIYGTMKSHSGLVDVQSEGGNGTVFHLYFPIVAKTKTTVSTINEDIRTHVSKGETLLLADDDPVVRLTTSEVLESWGYTVLQAVDGIEALAVFKEHQDEIALVLLDVIMPRCGGVEFAARVRKINADMPVIFMTGYDRGQVLADGELIENGEVLTKPVKFDELSNCIRKMLD